MSKYKILAIIPARGGSKRISNKNIRNFLGRPLIAYTIEQALSCSFIDRVIVDTDSPQIAKIALKLDAEVPWLRPNRLAQDKSNNVDSFLYNLQKLKEKEDYQPDYVMILQTTSPLREKKDILDCWKLMQKGTADTVLTVCPTHPRLYHLDANNKLILVNGNKKEKRSQNIQVWKPGYILNGCFVYIVKTSALLKEKTVITRNSKAVICPRWRSVDLDSYEDWAMAEFIYKNKKMIAKKIKELNEKK
jgi:N-acylneuraminate cytidylyltransferase/CMP-N,N'-diacetyllegionaminic acid synthase